MAQTAKTAFRTAAVVLASLQLFLTGCVPVYADDQAFEQYSMDVSNQIAAEQAKADAAAEQAETDAAAEKAGQETEGLSGENESPAVTGQTEDDPDSPIHRGVDKEETDGYGILSVVHFHGYEWGTELAKIADAEVTDDLKDSAGYSLKKVDRKGNTLRDEKEADGQKLYDVLGVKGYQIAGYDATSFYVFEDGKLTGGVYEYFMSPDGFDDTLSQCREEYGEPVFLAEESDAGSEDDPAQSEADLPEEKNPEQTEADLPEEKSTAQSETDLPEEKSTAQSETDLPGGNEAAGGNGRAEILPASDLYDEDGLGNWAIWADPDGNFIFAVQSLGVVYGRKDSVIISIFSDGIENSCGIDLGHTVKSAAENRMEYQ